jgi:hypothetical protein
LASWSVPTCKEASTKAVAASERFEAAALALAVADPKNAEARQISSESLKGAVRADAAEVALEKAAKLDAAGVADGEVCSVAAAAAVVLSRLDEAAAWIAKAKAAGARKDRLAELEATIDHDRLTVDDELAKRTAAAAADDLPRVKIATSAGDVVVELFENEAPNTVANCATRANVSGSMISTIQVRQLEIMRNRSALKRCRAWSNSLPVTV